MAAETFWSNGFCDTIRQYSFCELEQHWILDAKHSRSFCRQEIGTVREHLEEWFQYLYTAILQIVKNIPEQIMTLMEVWESFISSIIQQDCLNVFNMVLHLYFAFCFLFWSA